MRKQPKRKITQLALHLAERASRNRSRCTGQVVLQAVDGVLRCQRVVHREQNRLVRAIKNGWWAAARRVVADGRYEREELTRTLEEYNRVVGEFADNAHRISGAGELLVDLETLAEEFSHLDWDDEWLRVTTEPIVLEGIQLGHFEIRLRLDRLGSPSPRNDLEIAALDPNPAAAAHQVTHPHVSDGALCPGDAAAPLRLALEQGRLGDVFEIIRSVLTTYNPHSAYVKLDEWDGTQCYECDASMRADDSFYCEGCDNEFCEHCHGCCCGCENSRCGGCLTDCSSCGDGFCSSCLLACQACGVYGLCDLCLEDGVCESCRKDEEEEDNDQENEDDRRQESCGKEDNESMDTAPEQAVGAHALIHARGVDQAPVPVPSR